MGLHCVCFGDAARFSLLPQGVSSGSGTIHINASHSSADVADQHALRQVKSVAPTTATPTTVAMVTSVQPIADGIQGNGKARRSPSPRGGGEEQVRAKRLSVLAEQRQKKEQLRQELGGGGSEVVGRTAAMSAVGKEPPHEVCERPVL